MISSASEHSDCDGSVTVYVVDEIWINNIVKNVVIGHLFDPKQQLQQQPLQPKQHQQQT
tara:strand:- start:936 stop:1112 length:177 start_codon:yes stop_codon:yes gene_type:complete